MMLQDRKLGFLALVSLVVGSMIGGGIFSMPGDMAQEANSGAVLVAWLITGLGVIMLALTFQNLADRYPHLDNGIYSYAKEGFGQFIGFLSAWGYWLANMLTIVASSILLFSALSYFFPVFEDGNNLISIACASVLIWMLHIFLLRGLNEAAVVNGLITLAKLIPIGVFIVILFAAFQLDTFRFRFWGSDTFDWSVVGGQVNKTMLITVWAFLGIEGAVVFSGRARRRKDVGKATVMGLLGTLIIYMLVSLLSYGIFPREQLAGLRTPSMAYVLEHVLGPWGAALINIGLIISLFGLVIGMSLLSAETLFVAAKDRVLPKWAAYENKNGTPAGSFWITTLSVQVVLLFVIFMGSTYQTIYQVTTTAILLPYLFSTAYLVKSCLKASGRKKAANGGKGLVFGLFSSIYAGYLLYAAGFHNLLYASVLYGAGLILFFRVYRQDGGKSIHYSKTDALLTFLILLMCLYCLLSFASFF